MQGRRRVSGHVLGAQRVRRAARRVVQRLVEQPLEVASLGRARPARRACPRCRWRRSRAARPAAGSRRRPDVEALAEAGRGVPAFERDLADEQVAERVQQQVARATGNAGSACAVAVAAPTAGRRRAGPRCAGAPARGPPSRATRSSRSWRKMPSPRCSTAGTHSAGPRAEGHPVDRLQVAALGRGQPGEADQRAAPRAAVRPGRPGRAAGRSRPGSVVGTARKSASCRSVVGRDSSCHSASSRSRRAPAGGWAARGRGASRSRAHTLARSGCRGGRAGVHPVDDRWSTLWVGLGAQDLPVRGDEVIDCSGPAAGAARWR